MLKLQNVVKNYGAFSLHCSLELKSGQLSALIGQNGAGKSTTFKAILGLISIDGGEIEVLGKPVQELTPEEKEYVGVVLSDSGFSGYLNIKDILPVMDNMYTKFEKAEFLRQCQRFALPNRQPVWMWSQGMNCWICFGSIWNSMRMPVCWLAPISLPIWRDCVMICI